MWQLDPYIGNPVEQQLEFLWRAGVLFQLHLKKRERDPSHPSCYMCGTLLSHLVCFVCVVCLCMYPLNYLICWSYHILGINPYHLVSLNCLFLSFVILQKEANNLEFFPLSKTESVALKTTQQVCEQIRVWKNQKYTITLSKQRQRKKILWRRNSQTRRITLTEHLVEEKKKGRLGDSLIFRLVWDNFLLTLLTSHPLTKFDTWIFPLYSLSIS